MQCRAQGEGSTQLLQGQLDHLLPPLCLAGHLHWPRHPLPQHLLSTGKTLLSYMQEEKEEDLQLASW